MGGRLLICSPQPAGAAYLQHLNTSYSFGPSFDVANQAIPAYNGISEMGVFGGPETCTDVKSSLSPVLWSISEYSNNDAGCPATPSYFSLQPSSTYSASLSIGLSAVSIASCPSGMSITLLAARASDLTQFATCTVSVSVVQVRVSCKWKRRGRGGV